MLVYDWKRLKRLRYNSIVFLNRKIIITARLSVIYTEKISYAYRMRCCYNFRKRLFMWYWYKIIRRKHTTLLAKNSRHPYALGMAFDNVLQYTKVAESNVFQYIVKPTWPYRESTGAVPFIPISALLFWHTDVHTKFAFCGIKVKWMCYEFGKFRFVRNSEDIIFNVVSGIIVFT